jgi:hypothetical protein
LRHPATYGVGGTTGLFKVSQSCCEKILRRPSNNAKNRIRDLINNSTRKLFPEASVYFKRVD